MQLGDIREEERGIFFLGGEGLCTYVEELMWQVWQTAAVVDVV